MIELKKFVDHHDELRFLLHKKVIMNLHYNTLW